MRLLQPRLGIFNLVKGSLHAEHDGEQGWYEAVAEAVLVTVDDALELLGLGVGLWDAEFLSSS